MSANLQTAAVDAAHVVNLEKHAGSDNASFHTSVIRDWCVLWIFRPSIDHA